MKLLLISNSTNAGEPYLKYPIGEIGKHLAGIKEIAFVPYAAVTFSYDEYEAKVQARFDEIGVRVRSVHREADPAAFIASAEAIAVGGGNTFALTRKMQEQGLMDVPELDLAVEMTRQGLCGPYRSCRSHSKKSKGEDDVSCSHAFKVEVGCSP